MNIRSQTARTMACAFFVFTLLFTSCKKDEPSAPLGGGLTITAGGGLFVTDEGNFQGGNAKLSYYRYSDGSAYEDMFRPVNLRPLGDVCQSLTFINGKAYVVVNNSGKIEVIDPISCRSERTITGFVSPRYMQQVSASKAYVTDLYLNGVSIVDITSNTITGTIAIPGMTEAILVSGTKVFVSCIDRDKLYVIDAISDAVIDSITVAKGGNSMVLDANGKIWELAYGDYFTSAPGGLTRINPATDAVELALPFTTFDSPTRLCVNPTMDTLLYLNYAVMKMPITAGALPFTPFIAQGSGQSFYGLNVNPVTNEVFVTDAVDYSQRGHLLRYNANGTLLDDKIIGVIPGGIYFY